MKNKKDCCIAESDVRLEKAYIGKNKIINCIPLVLVGIILVVSLFQTFDILSMQSAVLPDTSIQNVLISSKVSTQAAPTMVGGC